MVPPVEMGSLALVEVQAGVEDPVHLSPEQERYW